MEVRKHANANKDIILVGHEGHPEVEGTMGRHENSENSSIYLVENENDAKNIRITKKIILLWLPKPRLVLMKQNL